MTNSVAPARRPAHRPSRRAHIIESAMRLFARVSFDDVTVGDIAEAADMTPAAVYYHFAGKEQILLEGIREFSDDLLATARGLVDERTPVGDLIAALLEFIRKRRTSSVVYFVNSAGLNLALEGHRKLVRAELAELFSEAARHARGRLPAPDAGAIGAGLVSLLEVSAASVLKRDQAYKSLGARRIPMTVASLADRIAGVGL